MLQISAQGSLRGQIHFHQQVGVGITANTILLDLNFFNSRQHRFKLRISMNRQRKYFIRKRPGLNFNSR